MAETTITGAWQIRRALTVAPDIDVTGVADVGQDEVQAAVDAMEAKGYFGHAPEEGS